MLLSVSIPAFPNMTYKFLHLVCHMNIEMCAYERKSE